MSFEKRKIRLSVQLASDSKTNQPKTFTESGTDTANMEDFRISARIENSGTPAGSRAHVLIWGLSQSLMNQLSTLGMVFNIVAKNTLTIAVGTDSTGMTTVFAGTVVTAYADLNQAPNVPFIFECNAGLADGVAPAVPTTFTGQAKVADIMSGFARQMGLSFENNGVDASLQSPYFPGNLREQLRDCAESANINAEVVNGTTLAIWPKGGARKTPSVPLVSPETGLELYPSFTQNGIRFSTLFNPNISFGGLVNIQSRVIDNARQSQSADASQVLPANGEWSVFKLDHAFDSQVAKGRWHSAVQAYNPKYPRPISPGVQP